MLRLVWIAPHLSGSKLEAVSDSVESGGVPVHVFRELASTAVVIEVVLLVQVLCGCEDPLFLVSEASLELVLELLAQSLGLVWFLVFYFLALALSSSSSSSSSSSC